MQPKTMVKKARLHSPLKNFALEEQIIEYRIDPLTGESTLIAPGRAEYVQKMFAEDDSAVNRYYEKTAKECPFCPENLEGRAARFPKEVLEEGILHLGEIAAFPSLFAHSEYNAVIVLGSSHKRRLNEFTSSLLAQAIMAAQRLLRRMATIEPSIQYSALILNYLPPAGSSIAHPHAQLLASSIPFNRLRILISESRRLFEEEGICYWQTLIEEEKRRGERYLARLGSVEWYLPFAPLRQNEVRALFPWKSSLNELDREDIEGAVEGLTSTLRFYSEHGEGSFNLCIYSAQADASKYFWAGVEVASRPGLRPLYLNDTWGLPLLMHSSEIFEAPEALCKRMKPYFAC